jgi:tRNA modification GTPase
MAKDFSSGLSSALAGGAETIVARATPAGRGGLAVIRVSGSGVGAAAAVVCPGLDLSVERKACLVRIRNAGGADIERAVVIAYRGPRSYTGEDMLEVMVHGSPFVVEETVKAFQGAGARPAEPGEFTRRAVANGKLDLIQAEAVRDLTAADTAWQARMARAQAKGVLSQRFEQLRSSLVDLLAGIEGALDFSHHDVPFDQAAAEAGRDGCLLTTRALLETAVAGRKVRDGVRVVILGEPNAGKSTLFNTLVGAEKAIVSPFPGTTRDLVEAEIDLSGVRVILQDTAGLGKSTHPVEREGVRRAEGAAATADVVVWMWPVDGDPHEPSVLAEGRPVLRLRSKADLDVERARAAGWIPVSCRSEEGLEAFRRELVAEVGSGLADLGGEVAVAARHIDHLTRAAAELEAGVFSEPELAAEAVRAALEEVRELTGDVLTEHVLDRVFASFCIGK